MNFYDSFPVDYTGHGPTGTGGAPTAAEHQQRMRNLHMTAQMARAAAVIDPVALAAAERIVRLQHGMSDASPGALRRALFNSAAGQVALDSAMMLRTTGMLGQGDPITAAANIAQGVAGGGFRMSIGGTGQFGNREFGIGRVGGSGAVAEHVSGMFMKKVMRDMYGVTGDTSNMHGFNSQEVSEVFQTFAQRGGIGHVAHLQQNADLQTRLDAATDNAVEPGIQSNLQRLGTMFKKKLKANPGLSPEAQAEALTVMTQSFGDKKLSKEIDAVIKSPDALIGNKDEVRRVGKIVKDITGALTGVADLYHELSPKALQQKLESISGMKITNSKQAIQAAATFADLRGAAMISGIDPKAFVDWSMDKQATSLGQVQGIIGADGRHRSVATGINADIHNRIMVDSAIASRQSNNAVMLGRSLGVDMDDSQTFEEIYTDKHQGRMQYLDRYQGMTMARGGMDNLSGARREDAENLLKKFDKETDPAMRYNMEQQMRSMLASAFSSPGNEVGFEELQSSLTGKRMLGKAYKDPAKSREMEKQARAERLDAIQPGMLINYLKDSGAADAEDVSEIMLKDLGADGMGELLLRSKQIGRIGKDGKESKTDLLSGEDRVKMMRDILKTAKVTDTEADGFMGQFFDKNGQVKDKKVWGQAMNLVHDANPEPDSTFAQANAGQSKLEMMGAGSSRRRLSAADGSISFNSIATALATGRMKGGISDPESMVLMLETMKREGINMPKVLDKDGNIVAADTQFESGIDFSKGLTKEGMEKLAKVNGGEKIDIAKKMGFENDEALWAATATDKNLRHDAIKQIQRDYPGINLTGDPTKGLDSDGRGGMTAITDSAKESGGAPLNKKAQQGGAAMLLAQAMGLKEDEKSTLMDSIAKGGPLDFSAFEAGKFDKHTWGSEAKFDGPGIERMRKLSARVGMANKDEMKGFVSLNEGGAMVNVIDEQIKQVNEAIKAKKVFTTVKDDAGNSKEMNLEAFKKELEANRLKVMNQMVEDGGGTVTSQIVVHGDIRVTGLVKKDPE